MMRAPDITGQRFGMLTVLSLKPSERAPYIWRCRCDCGTVKEIDAKLLKKGDSVSCGCKRSAPQYVAADFDKYVVKVASGCWEWSRRRDEKGYGYFWQSKGRRGTSKRKAAHRWSYEIHKGVIPEGLHVCHACDNPCCVNPDHLWVGTASDNMRDMWNKGRGPKGYKRKPRAALHPSKDAA